MYVDEESAVGSTTHIEAALNHGIVSLVYLTSALQSRGLPAAGAVRGSVL